jgi:two-component system, sensor histidine kinase ChiS
MPTSDPTISAPESEPQVSDRQDGDAARELAELRTRFEELQHERDHLVAVVDILQAISGSVHFTDILQTIARQLGETFGLDRSSIFLARESEDVRLVATYEDPSIRNMVIDLARYPELQRVFDSGETVVIADAASDPMLADIKPLLDMRNVRSIVVAPIRWRGQVIGAIFVRTERDAKPFSDSDIRFLQVVASLTAKALRAAQRFESMMRATQDSSHAQRRGELQRIALLSFVRRLLDRYAKLEDHVWAETLLPKESDDELERLVSVAMKVVDEETKG